MQVTFIVFFCILSSIATEDSTVVNSEYPWLRLPPTPKLPRPRRGHYATINGIRLWYQIYGSKYRAPVLFLHGGFGNSDYWGQQVKSLRNRYRCIVMDLRGHGRTTMTSANLTYDLMASDVIGLLDRLQIPKINIIAWSDGAITALNIAMNYPRRVNSLYVFAANYVPSGIKDLSASPVFTAFLARSRTEYERLNPKKDYKTLYDQLMQLWSTLPNWNAQDFARIESDVFVWIVDGDHEEAIYREQADTMASWIPQAGELILPRTSFFAFMQNPAFFTVTLRQFLIEAVN